MANDSGGRKIQGDCQVDQGRSGRIQGHNSSVVVGRGGVIEGCLLATGSSTACGLSTRLSSWKWCSLRIGVHEIMCTTWRNISHGRRLVEKIKDVAREVKRSPIGPGPKCGPRSRETWLKFFPPPSSPVPIPFLQLIHLSYLVLDTDQRWQHQPLDFVVWLVTRHKVMASFSPATVKPLLRVNPLSNPVLQVPSLELHEHVLDGLVGRRNRNEWDDHHLVNNVLPRRCRSVFDHVEQHGTGASAALASPTCSAVLMPSRNKTSAPAVTEGPSLATASSSSWICSAFWPAQPHRSVYRYGSRLSCERPPSELLQYSKAPALHSALGLFTSLLNSTHR